MFVAFALTSVASPASAHDELIGSDPAADAHLDAVPQELQLTFSGLLLDEPGATQVVVTDAAGAALTVDDPVLDGTRLTQGLTGSASGTVTVVWRVVSSDGHPVSGEFSFTVGEAEATTPTPTASPAPAAPVEDGSRVGWIVLGIVAIGLLGALVAVLLRRARNAREDN